MTHERDISWKDLLALFVGYLVSGTWGIMLFLGLVYLRVQGILPEETSFLYQFFVGVGMFIGFVVAGISLAKIRASVGVRNAAVLFAIMLFIGFLRMDGDMVSVQGMFVIPLRMVGIPVGAWSVQRRYRTCVQKV